MPPPLSHAIAERVAEAPPLYHRLVLVVGPMRSGKTAALRSLQAKRGWPLVNVNLSLSERLLELTARQRALKVERIVNDLVNQIDQPVVLLDNLEMLFHPELSQDPLRLLQRLSRNRTIVATWRGLVQGTALVYASPEHAEYRRYEPHGALIVTAPPSAPASVASSSSSQDLPNQDMQNQDLPTRKQPTQERTV